MKYNVSEIENIARERLSEKRAKHTFNCANLARDLAARYGASEKDAYIAGLLHDITKEESDENQLKLCKKRGIILDSLVLSMPQLIHAITAAEVAREEFGASEEICRAILYHTTGCRDMSTIDKCLWLADLIEPGRCFPGVDEIRKEAEVNLNNACLMGIERTLSYLSEGGKMVHPAMLDARDELERILKR